MGRFACGLFLGLGVQVLLAQSSGVIHGIVVDPQGAVIAGAKVSAIDEDKAIVVRETTTGTDGAFRLLPLLRGTYKVRIEMSAFKVYERSGLVLDPNQIMNLGEIVMQVGGVTEAVTVTAAAPVIETSTGQKSYVISAEEVNELSVNGRDFTSLMKNLPGVTTSDESDFSLSFNSTTGFNVNGLRNTMNNVMLDGAINTDVGANDGQYTAPSLDSVGEFKVQTSVFAAEHGRNAGVLLQATTKSGTKQFRGTLYEFFRNDALDANRFFNNLAGLPTPPVRFNQFGGNLGGPIYWPNFSTRKQPRLFFFVNLEATRGSRPVPGQTNYVDTWHPDLLQGDFRRLLRFNAAGQPSVIAGTNINTGAIIIPGTMTRNTAGNVTGGQPFPDNIVPKSMWSRNAEAFLYVINRLDHTKGIPVPGRANNPELVRIFFKNNYELKKFQKLSRVDLTISPRNSLFWRWVDDSQRETQPRGIFGFTDYPVYPTYRKKPGASWAWNLVSVVSSRMTNEFSFAYNHLTQLMDIDEKAPKSAYDRDAAGFTFKELFPEANLRNKFPRFSCGTGCGLANILASGWMTEARTFAWTDNLTRVQGAHQFKTGIFVNMNQNGQGPTWTDAININFGPNTLMVNDSNQTLANLLLGNYYSITQTEKMYYGGLRFFGIEFYGQDSWRVGRRLSLELGARYVYLGPTYTRGNLLARYFDPERYDPAKAVSIQTAAGLGQGRIIPGSGDPFNGIIEENTLGVPSGYVKHRKNQVSPRFGFAWDPFGSGKTSVRGGFGIFWERIRQGNYFSALGNPPLNYTPTIYNGKVDEISPALVAGGVRFPVSVTAMDKEGKIPTVYSWSFGVQRQLPFRMSLDASYVGNVARHLQYVRDINQLPLGTTVNTTILQQANNQQNAIRPYRGYTSINFTDCGASSNYHSLQARVSRRFTKALTMNINYTWSKAITDAESDGQTLLYYLDRKSERATASYDRTQTLSVNYVYMLPAFGSKLSRSYLVRGALNGWQVSGISRFWTGMPLTIRINGNPGTLGSTTIRADYVGDGAGDIIPAERDYTQWFNPYVFARPQNGQLGNTGRGIVRGPGVNNFDISLFKNFRLAERRNIQFRLETFNTFNHTQWFAVNTTLNVPNPGQVVSRNNVGTGAQVTTTRDPRNVQLSIKLYF